MSLTTDRADAIVAAIEADHLTRRVFLMPRDEFTCRIVAVPADWDEVMAWVRAEAEVEVGGFALGTDISDIVEAVEQWWSVPRGTLARVSH